MYVYVHIHVYIYICIYIYMNHVSYAVVCVFIYIYMHTPRFIPFMFFCATFVRMLHILYDAISCSGEWLF